MNTYQAIYGGERIEVHATSSYKAQLIAAARFKTIKTSDVIVILVSQVRAGLVAPDALHRGSGRLPRYR